MRTQTPQEAITELTEALSCDVSIETAHRIIEICTGMTMAVARCAGISPPELMAYFMSCMGESIDVVTLPRPEEIN